MTRMPMPFSNPYDYGGAHTGIDFAQREGTSIRAIHEGTITFAGWYGTRVWWEGRWVQAGGLTKTLTRPDGLQIMHCHLRDLTGPGVGSKVKYAQHIGPVGNTGRSTGPHLHLEMWLRGVAQREWDWMDPNNWIGKGGSSGGGGTPFPPPSITKEDEMIFYYVNDALGRIARTPATAKSKGWVLFNPFSGKFGIPLINDGTQVQQDRADSWARTYGGAIVIREQDAMNAQAAALQTL